MKAMLALTGICLCTLGAQAQQWDTQCEIVFNNWLPQIDSGPMMVPATVVAPIYGPEPWHPLLPKWGNTADGFWPGTQTYGGEPLAGSGYTAELWMAPGWVSDESYLHPIAATTFYIWGFIVPTNVAIPFSYPPPPYTFQVRVYRNRGWLPMSWQDVTNDPSIPRGVSHLFMGDVSDTSLPWGPQLICLEGLESFNIHPDWLSSYEFPVTTTPTLTLTNVQPSDSGTYWVVVRSACGSVTSQVVTLQVGLPEPPTITSQPLSRTNDAGTVATFTVTATGTEPLSYQWRFNGINLPGDTSASLVLSCVQPAQAGSYTVVVTNAWGAVTSAPVSLTVYVPCQQSPPGLVGWWPGDGDARDHAGTNDGQFTNNGTYVAGKVGQAFQFNDSSPRHDEDQSAVVIPASASLDVGAGSGLTIELWIQPADLQNQHPLVEWDFGAHFWIATGPPNGPGPGCLYAHLDQNWMEHIIYSAINILTTNAFQHVALTYDKASGSCLLYLNGTVVATNNFGSITPQTTSTLYLGQAWRGPADYPWWYYKGLMDEVSIYNRALSPTEIQAVYGAGSAGKCKPVMILAGPASQTVVPGLGCDVTFSVVAKGSEPLSYQWWFNGTNLLSGQRNAMLTLPSVQMSDCGSYRVVVSNVCGTVTSSPALLSLDHPPVATNDIIQRFAWGGVKVNVADLLTNAFDPDGDPLAIISAGPTSTNGGTVSLRGNWAYYTPPTNYTGTDSFTYTVSDGHCGGTNDGTVTVLVNPEPPTWQAVAIPNLPSNCALRGVWARTPNEVYVTADRPTPGATNYVPEAFVFKYDGSTWTQVLYLPGHEVARGVFGTGSSEVFVMAQGCGIPWSRPGVCVDPRGEIWRSTNGGVSWEQQMLPSMAESGSLADISGTPGNVHVIVVPPGAVDRGGGGIIRFDGTNWSVVSQPWRWSSQLSPFLSPNEGYLVFGGGWGRWDGGTNWTIHDFGPIFDDTYGTWAMRDGAGRLQWYATGNHNSSDRVCIWRFVETNQYTGNCFGGKNGQVFSDSSESHGSGEQMWGSAPDDVYVLGFVGWENRVERLYHYDGTNWSLVTAVTNVNPSDISGTARDDVWLSLQEGWLLHGHAGVQIKVDNAPSCNFIRTQSDGSVQLTFAGIPWWTYRIQYTESLSPPNWQTLTNLTADALGAYQYVDRPPTNAPSRFYRSVFWP